MTFHRTIIYCTHTCKKKNKNTKCFILWVSLSVTTRSLPRPCVFCSASAWGKPNTHQTVLCLLIWVWVGLDRTVMPSEGREADPLWGLANSSCLSTQTPCPEIKGSSWYGKKKKKKDCPIYSMLLSVGAVHDHQDTATKNTTNEVHISHSDSFIWLKYTWTERSYPVLSLCNCAIDAGSSQREIKIKSFRSPWLSVQRAGTPPCL